MRLKPVRPLLSAPPQEDGPVTGMLLEAILRPARLASLLAPVRDCVAAASTERDYN
jgi:hypothetical protein